MRLDRKMVFLNAAFLALLGLGLAARTGPAFPKGVPWDTRVAELFLGMAIGGVGLALAFLRRLTQPADCRRLAAGWMVANYYLVTLVWELGKSRLNPLEPGAWRHGEAIALAFLHLALLVGCGAAVIRRQGEELQSHFQVLLLAEAALAILAGYGLSLAVGVTPLSWDAGPVIRYLGIELVGLAVALAFLANPRESDERRRLLLGTGAAHALGAVTVLFALSAWGTTADWAWALVPVQVALAVGSLWAGLRPERTAPVRTRREMVSWLTWSYLLASAAAGSVAAVAPALSLSPWVAFSLAVLLALGVAALFGGDTQRDLLSAAGPAGWPLSAPGPETDEAARQTWLRQVGEAAAQEERNRLARDLHDSIKQQIFGIHVSAAAAQARWESDPEGARKALADVRRSAHEAMVEMQAMLHQLRPEALGAAGLIEALREQCEALGYRTGAAVVLELGEPLPEDRMPPGAPDTLFRIAQEMLANVARHARAQEVRLWLGRRHEEAELRIEDDGQGFDPAATASGLGLRHLRERAESLGGQLEIASAPGEGTRISIRAPLTPAAAPSPSPLANALKSERGDRFFYPIAASFLILQDSFVKFFLIFLTLYLTCAKEWSVRSALRRFPDAPLTDVQELQYLSLRNRAFLLLAGSWAAIQELLTSGRRLWMIPAGLCLALMILSALRVYRWSRPRPLPDWVWPSGWERSGGSAVFLLGITLILAVPLAMGALRLLQWLRPENAVFLSLTAAVLLYFLWRRPRQEGAAS